MDRLERTPAAAFQQNSYILELYLNVSLKLWSSCFLSFLQRSFLDFRVQEVTVQRHMIEVHSGVSRSPSDKSGAARRLRQTPPPNVHYRGIELPPTKAFYEI